MFWLHIPAAISTMSRSCSKKNDVRAFFSYFQNHILWNIVANIKKKNDTSEID